MPSFPAPPPLPVRIGYRLLQRVVTLDVTHLMLLQQQDTACSAQEIEPRANFRLLTPADVRHHCWDRLNDLEPGLAPRLSSGLDYCMAAIVDGRLASYAWYAIGSIEAEHNRGGSPHSGTALAFPPAFAFLYRGFTHPQFRGRGLYAAVHAAALEALAPHGVNALLATADWTNLPALRSCARIGFRSLGRIWRFGVSRHVAGVYPIAAKIYGVRVGNSAAVHPRAPLAA